MLKPRKQKCPKKPKMAPAKKGKGSPGMRQTVKVSVRVWEGAGGGGAPPIVYATYAPTPRPAQPTQFIVDDGMPPAPVKRGPAHHRSTGVGADATQPSTTSTGTQVKIRDLLTGHAETQVRLRIKIIHPRGAPIV